jgi:uroporphyrinogen decarboxylase
VVRELEIPNANWIQNMNSRQRFSTTMGLGQPDRVPYFTEGIRADVVQAWQEQGLSPDRDLADMFHLDRREEILPVLEPQPYPKCWPTNMRELEKVRGRWDAGDNGRLPQNYQQIYQESQNRDYPILLRVHRGLFQTLGIMDWRRFAEVMYLLVDDPDFVRELMTLQAEFVCQLTESILQEIPVDAVVFSEPIAGNDNPLVSPRMYEELALTSYTPILDLVRNHGVETIIFRTYANARILIPSVLKWGFNCLWACETNPAAMDYADLRREFGRDLRLIGGIDTDVLRQGKQAIQREVEEKVPPLLAEGGFIPLADGRIRVDIPFENYIYYRQLLAKVTTG